MTKWKWRGWILGVALLGMCGECALLWGSSNTYSRYVSLPLEDGTRYTFLYPARMSIIPRVETSVSLESEPNLWAGSKALRWLGWPREVMGAQVLEISVLVNPFASQRSSRIYSRDGSGSQIVLADAHSKSSFYAYHYQHEGQEQIFLREDEVFSKSFQILPPHAPAPSP